VAVVENDKRMSNKTNDLLQEDLALQFDEAILRGDLADAQRVIDCLKEAGLPYERFAEELLVEKAHNGDVICQ
jgi:hypothetical protein